MQRVEFKENIGLIQCQLMSKLQSHSHHQEMLLFFDHIHISLAIYYWPLR